MSNEDESFWSIKRMTICLAVVAALFSWTFMSCSYPNGRPGVDIPEFGSPSTASRVDGIILFISMAISTVITAVTMIPSAFSVLHYTWNHEFWLIKLTFCMQGLIILGGIGMWRLELAIDPPSLRKRRMKKKRYSSR